jgi:hypothetical protein
MGDRLSKYVPFSKLPARTATTRSLANLLSEIAISEFKTPSTRARGMFFGEGSTAAARGNAYL